MIKNFLLVALGGALGSMFRYGGTLLIGSKNFPYATLTINIIGSFIIGFLFALSLKGNFFLNEKLLWMVGFCGGFTTFSAFSIESIRLLQNGKHTTALVYIATSIVLTIIAAWLGFKLTTDD